MNNARSAVPGLAIAVGVLIAGLLLALTVGRYPVGLGDLVNVLFSKVLGSVRMCRPLSKASYCRFAARA
jgi:iron complex transport system permease protein